MMILNLKQESRAFCFITPPIIYMNLSPLSCNTEKPELFISLSGTSVIYFEKMFISKTFLLVSEIKINLLCGTYIGKPSINFFNFSV